MSFSKMGRILPTANGVPEGTLRQQYPLAVAGALRDELGDTHRAIKTVVRWTGQASELPRIGSPGQRVQAASISLHWHGTRAKSLKRSYCS